MKKITLLILSLISNLIIAQDLGISNPQITRPSTNVANLMAFEEIPVSNYTGIPDIKVPLFNLPTRSKDIALNMFLAYHPSNGVKYNTQAGDTGQGWSLFAGGVISSSLIHAQNNVNVDTNYSNICQFNFFGNSGRFYIDKLSNGTLNLRILENSNTKLKFELDYNISNSKINSITAYDDLGYKFVFDVVDYSVYLYHNNGFLSYNSAFHLSRVYDNNNQELINFTYNHYNPYNPSANLFYNYNSSYKKLKEINVLGHGKVLINYNTTENTITNNFRILNIELKDVNNVSKKIIKLHHENNFLNKVEVSSPDETLKEFYNFSYKNDFTNNLGTLTNDELGFIKFIPKCHYNYPIDNNNSNPFFNKFITEGVLESMTIPTGGKFTFDFESNTYKEYFLDNNGNAQIDNNNDTYTNFEKNPENNNINTIVYKKFEGGTDNYTNTFTIPGNDIVNPVYYHIKFDGIPYSTTDSELPNVTNINNNNQNIVHHPFFKIHGYGYESGSHHINYYPYQDNDNNLCLGIKLPFYQGKTYTISIHALAVQHQKGSVHVTSVTPKSNPVLVKHDSGIRIKKISYFDNLKNIPSKEVNFSYNLFNNPSVTSGIRTYTNIYSDVTNNLQSLLQEPVGYRNVTVWETGIGKTEYSYTSLFDFNYTRLNTTPLNLVYYDYRLGILKNQKVLDNNNLIAETNYNYDFVDYPNATPYLNNPPSIYFQFEKLGWSKLTKKTTTNHFAGNPSMTIIDEYTYDDDIRKVIKHTTKNSLGETLETQTKYHNTNSLTNRIAEVEEIKTFRNSDLLAHSKVNYNNTFAGNSAYLPNSFVSAKGTEPLTTKAKINAYDQYSNPLEVQQEKGTFTTYIWGYNKTKLIAKIENASNNLVATALSVVNVSQLTEAHLPQINALRTNTAFANVFITTATYIPLVGISTIIDSKGDTMTYEYDAFNRLRLVRDRDNNVVSESRYTTAAAGFGNLNHVTNIAYKSPTQNTITSPTITQANQSRVYLDGLGRPIQEIAHQQSGTATDIVSHIEYDQYGLRTINYLPYANSSASLNYNPNAKTEILAFPQYIGQSPFSETKLEASPLQRTLEQSAPGNDWKMGSNNTIRYEYQTNTNTDAVRKFTVSADASTSGSLGYYNISLSDAGNYTTGELIKAVVKNENWKNGHGNKNTTHTFKDKQGKTILVRTFNTPPSGVGGLETFDTYYVHDQFGNLTYMIPPKAEGSITQTKLDKLCFQYRYDHKNRLVEKKVPGKAWEYMVYDQLDRVAAMGPVYAPFTNFSGQRGWLIAKYDAMGRKILTAWISGTTTSAGRKTLQTNFDSTSETIYNENKTIANTTVNGVAFRYSNLAYPRTNYHVLTVNYFDDYNYTNAPNTFSTTMHDNSQAVFYNNTTQKPKGLATGSWVRVLETSTLYKNELSHILYDRYARAIRVSKTNHLGGYTQTDTKLDWAGKVTYTEVKHKRIARASETYIKESFNYNSQDRLTSHTHQVGLTGTPQVLARYTYNALGQNTNKRVGGTNSTGLQKIDYTYNIRGWLTDINNITNLAHGTDPLDLFAFKINYNTITNETGYTGKAQYNGNIAQVYWKTGSSPTELRKYDFIYDDLNRLKEAVYQRPGATNPIRNTYNEKIDYDKNGNITSLLRSGNNETTITQIDNLTYIYDTDSNQLTKVTDASNPTQGFIDGVNLTVEYTYDDFGNLTKDLNKGIGTTTADGILYNHLHLPTRVNKGTGTDNVQYTYNAAGQKLTKIVKQGSTTTTTEYLDGFQYKNTLLEFFGTAEGFYATGKYHYQYKDHLGNVRMTYSDDDNSGTITTNEIKEENHYYPYGLKHNGYGATPSTTNDAVKYKFNGKETQDELSLNITAMDFRQYDQALGRFYNIDALAEQKPDMTPFRFGFNNPMVFNDPSGLFESRAQAQDHIDAYGLKNATISFNESRGVYEVTNNGYTFWRIGNNIYCYQSSGGSTGTYFTDSFNVTHYSGVSITAIPGGALRNLSSYDFNKNIKENSSDDSVGQPGFWESLIPIWGSGRASIDHFQNGNYWRGIGYGLLAISDVFLVRAIVTGVIRGGIKIVGSHSWNATRKYYLKKGFAKSNQPLHHWLIHRNGNLGKHVPNVIKNQMWNLKSFGTQSMHMRAGHGMNFLGEKGFGLAGQLWFGTPTWPKLVVGSYGGRIIGEQFNSEEDGE